MGKWRVWLVQLPLVLLWTLAFAVTQRGDDGALSSRFLRGRVYPALRRMEGFYTDLKFRWRGPRPLDPKIVMVEIDEDAIKQIGRWPWHRDAMAVLIQSAFDAGARVVGLDIVFAEPDVRVPDGVVELLRGQNLADRLPAFETDLTLQRIIALNRDRLVLGWQSDDGCVPAWEPCDATPRAAQGLCEVRLRQGERLVSPGHDGARRHPDHHHQPRRLRRRGGARRLLPRLARSRRRHPPHLRRRDRRWAPLPVVAAGDGARRPR